MSVRRRAAMEVSDGRAVLAERGRGRWLCHLSGDVVFK